MKKRIKDYHLPGTAPGILSSVPGEEQHTKIHLLEYHGEQVNVVEIKDLPHLVQELRDGQPKAAVAWVHVIGLGDLKILSSLAELFKLHPLAMEDVTHLGQRPKVENYGELSFVVLQHLSFTQGEMKATQISLFVGKDIVLSFQPSGDDLFTSLRERICKTHGRIHERNADYLAYTLIDLIVDTAFPALDSFGERLDSLEGDIISNSRSQVVTTIYHLQRQLLALRGVLWPQREVLSRLMHDDGTFVSEEIRVYLRDSSDHAVQALDVVEGYREMVASLLNVHLSKATHRLTDVMRVLTVIATIFTPPTFIASIYGMNFDRNSPWNMPELGWEYGYLMVWGVIIVLVVGMLVYFRRKHWL